MTKIIYYTTINGENPVDDFLNSLNKKQQSKILRILINIETYGLITVIPHIKKLTGTLLWEIRILGHDNIRVLYISVAKRDVLLLHGFIKKTQKTTSKELNTALKRLNDYQERRNED